MSTEDDLRRGGQAAAALAGVAAARAKQIAEQLLGGRAKPRQEAKTKAEALVEEGKHAAAEVIGALRREASVMVEDLERLEHALRGDGGVGPGRARAARPRPGPAARKAGAQKVGAQKVGARKTAATKRAAAAKKTSGAKKQGAQPAKASPAAAKKSAPAAKKSVAGRTAAGGRGRPSRSAGRA